MTNTSSIHKTRNAITEPSTYKQLNPYLVDCYASLCPGTLSKISMVICSGILRNKMYYSEKSQYYSEAEAKRIYNSYLLTPEYILLQANPSKYNIEKKDVQKDISNLNKLINKLDEMNIFYVWKSGNPHVYMFFMERDFGCWKNFNSKGVVIPKTLAKILRQYRQIINTMSKMLKNDGQDISIQKTEDSFGNFINQMIDKMNPKTNNFSRWKGNGELKDYIDILYKEIKSSDEYSGLEQSDDFIDKLPISVREKMVGTEKKGKKMDFDLLEKTLVPENENVVKRSTAKKTRRTSSRRINKLSGHVLKVGLEAEAQGFEDSNPLKNCNELLKYYRWNIEAVYKDAKFPPYSIERKYATEILDILIENNQSTKTFIKGWIKYFVDFKLSEEYAKQTAKTSISNLKKTFKDYGNLHIEIV